MYSDEQRKLAKQLHETINFSEEQKLKVVSDYKNYITSKIKLLGIETKLIELEQQRFAELIENANKNPIKFFDDMGPYSETSVDQKIDSLQEEFHELSIAVDEQLNMNSALVN